jgi:L-lactate permease
MTTDEKIRLGFIALSAVAAVVAAAHFGGHVAIRSPFLDEIGGTASG